MRAPYQVLVFLFRRTGQHIEYALLRRADGGGWQGVAGGGEGAEAPLAAARRELWEEAGIADAPLRALSSCATIPVADVAGFLWGPRTLVIPEHCFAVEVAPDAALTLSHEHDECGWFEYERCVELLRWDSNRSALWELRHRINHDLWEP